MQWPGLAGFKGVLLLTLVPVIAGLLASAIYQVVTGAFPFGMMLPTMVIEVVLIGLMGFSYFNARTLHGQSSAP